MGFEWDDRKNEANKAKHGIGLESVEGFDWQTALAVRCNVHGETRFAATGYIGSLLHTVIFTHRGENIRIISLRPASRRERRVYHASP